MFVKGASIIVDDMKNLQTAKRTPEDKQSEKFSSGELKIKNSQKTGRFDESHGSYSLPAKPNTCSSLK